MNEVYAGNGETQPIDIERLQRKMILGSTEQAPDITEVQDSRISIKECPVCKAKVFEDMDICFNCMYLFGSNLELESRNNPSISMHKNEHSKSSSGISKVQDEVSNVAVYKTEAGSSKIEAGPSIYDQLIALEAHDPADMVMKEDIDESRSVRPERSESAERPVAASIDRNGERSAAQRPNARIKEPSFGEFLEEFERFLRDFIADREIYIE